MKSNSLSKVLLAPLLILIGFVVGCPLAAEEPAHDEHFGFRTVVRGGEEHGIVTAHRMDLFEIRVAAGGYSPRKRAEIVSQRLNQLAGWRNFSPEWFSVGFMNNEVIIQQQEHSAHPPHIIVTIDRQLARGVPGANGRVERLARWWLALLRDHICLAIGRLPIHTSGTHVGAVFQKLYANLGSPTKGMTCEEILKGIASLSASEQQTLQSASQQVPEDFDPNRIIVVHIVRSASIKEEEKRAGDTHAHEPNQHSPPGRREGETRAEAKESAAKEPAAHTKPKEHQAGHAEPQGVKPNSQKEPREEHKPAADVHVEMEPETKLAPEAGTEPKPETQTEPKTQPNTEPKIEAKTEQKTEAKAEQKTEPQAKKEEGEALKEGPLERVQGSFKVTLLTEPRVPAVGQETHLLVSLVRIPDKEDMQGEPEPVVGASIACALSKVGEDKEGKQVFDLSPEQKGGQYGFKLVFVEPGEYHLSIGVLTQEAEAFKVEFRFRVNAKAEGEEHKVPAEGEVREGKEQTEAGQPQQPQQAQQTQAATAPPAPTAPTTEPNGQAVRQAEAGGEAKAKKPTEAADAPRSLLARDQLKAQVTKDGFLELTWEQKEPLPESVTFTLVDRKGRTLDEQKLTARPFSARFRIRAPLHEIRAVVFYPTGIKTTVTLPFQNLRQ